VAFSMQQQRARVAKMNAMMWGALAAGEVAGAFVPGLGLVGFMGGGVAGSKMERDMAEQRARIALELMADGGFDPWQAPEAWRLLMTKKAPKDPELLKYPELSGYQLGILNLRYGKGTGIPVAAAQ
jgi:hypothetical protein